MAVRIVEEKPDPSVVKSRVCRNCGVKVEYLPLDVQTRHGRDYSGVAEVDEYVICPKCGKMIILKSW